MYICLFVYVTSERSHCRRSCSGSIHRPGSLPLADSETAMAGDSSTELLFLDTFKHQSAEVIFLAPFHSLVCLLQSCLRSILTGYIQKFWRTMLNFQANNG